MKKTINKTTLKFIYLCTLSVLFLNCSNDDDSDDTVGNWVKKSTFNEDARSSSTAFTIGNIGYMGTGYDGDDYYSDFWSYNMDTNSWQQLSDFPGLERSSAVSFVINGEGYIGTGYNGDSADELSDFYKYNSNTNSWTQIADFAGSARYGAVGFGSDTYGYIGTGYDGSDKKDFWKYDPIADTWEETFGFGGDKRRDAVTFTIGDDVYMTTGISNGVYEEDFWVFNLNTEEWTELEDIDEDYDYITRSNAVAFTINGLGYIACGDFGTSISSVYEYDPSDQEWEERTEFELYARRDAVSFSNGERAFVALGRNGTLYLDDNMEFFPNEEQDDDDN
ncbi:kelch repeat-containing protein [Oceanihabitans sp. 2_MG-2023]|uniref:Kelch repeat-containing protein n=1 Tax=Oceanihabitans sp. 2_MG-2023 TaxID=3062661 RepID=UPI0026E23613|nr:kelch repeat-containing protein [Oceanihabitans sp. 2_MG-2023]MDO6596627.1 kelch repeat-containing protein [Oceanihabitans sp. 2_MG-2023]